MAKEILAFLCIFMLHTAMAQDVDNANKKLTHDKVISGIFDYDLASRIVEETNRRREAEGRAPLKMTHKLCEVAMIRAVEAAPNLPHPYDYPHYRPNGDRFFSMLDQEERCYRESENLYWGGNDVIRIVDGYMQSEGHRSNLLDSLMTTIGVGTFKWYNDKGKLVEVTVNTQLFGDCPTNEDYRPTGVEKVQVNVTSKPGTKSKILKRETLTVAPDTK